MNLCRSCNSDFSSVRLFDRHRIGTHEYLFSEGLNMEPPREDGRRCLDEEEMVALGWERNRLGRWSDPQAVEAARKSFSTVGGEA